MNEDTEALLERQPMLGQLDLPENSRILVIGSYQGLTMELLDELYHPESIYGFDPQIWACDRARIRLKDRPNCHIMEYGLGRYNTTLPMGEWGTDACSFINVDSREKGIGHIWNAHDVLKIYYKTGNINLVLMNCEGYEFVLLPYLEEKGWLDRFDKMIIQWHLGIGKEPKTDMDIEEETDRLARHGLYIESDERPAWIYLVKT